MCLKESDNHILAFGNLKPELFVDLSADILNKNNKPLFFFGFLFYFIGGKQ